MYNIFVVVDCKTKKVLLVTSSARKAKSMFCKGIRVDIWSDNKLVETARSNVKYDYLGKYITLEKQYIADKQAKAESINKRRKGYGV